jgi:hypothetical protein
MSGTISPGRAETRNRTFVCCTATAQEFPSGALTAALALLGPRSNGLAFVFGL